MSASWDGSGIDPFLPQRIASEITLTRAERRMYAEWWGSFSAWLVKVHRSVLGSGVTPDASAVWQHAPAWAEQMDAFVQGPVRDTMGIAYNQLFGAGYDFDARPFVSAYLGSVHNRMVRTPNEVYDLVASTVARGAGRGDSIPDIASRVDEILTTTGTERWASRAVTVARTETIGALSSARADSFAAIAEESDVPMEQIWLCVAPDTPVAAAGVSHVSRRPYTGPIVRLTAVSGRSVALTPNHEVLTEAGWVAAKDIRPDDRVRRTVRGSTAATARIGSVVDDALAAAGMDRIVREGTEAVAVRPQTTALLGGDGSGQAPGLEYAAIARVAEEDFDGYVYDLTTAGGWYAADGLIVHNSTLDSRTRDTHAEADGQRVAVGEPFIVGGASLDYPGDPFGPPGEVINCRCSTLLVESGEEVDMTGRGFTDDWDTWEADLADGTPLLPEAQQTPPSTATTSREEKARIRQATIDTARSGGKVAAELDEVVANVEGDLASSAKAVEARIAAGVARGALPEDVAAELRAALAAGDPEAFTSAAWKYAETLGVTPVERAGQVVKFDRKLHRALEGSVSGDVVVVRPGLRWTPEDLVLEKAIVEEASAADIAAARFPSGRAPSLATILDDAETGAKAGAFDLDPATIGRWVDGEYAGLRVKVTDAEWDLNGVTFQGQIFNASGVLIGDFERHIGRNDAGELYAHHAFLQIVDKYQGAGFQAEFNGNLLDWYKRSGLAYVKVGANIDVGGYTWARAGYDFAKAESAKDLFTRLYVRLQALTGQAARAWEDGYRYTGRVVIPAAKAPTRAELRKLFRGASDREIDRQLRLAREFVDGLAGREFGRDLPSAYELSQLGRWAGASKDDVWIGKLVMLGSSWYGVLRL